MKILSLVVPAYNSEKFLDKGIPSMLAPEILDKLEIIIVNDGSTDGTAAAAEKYCVQYPDTVRLINQENKGHGGALNTGFSAAVGKFIKPVDSDDWVQTENLVSLIRCLETCESDAVLTHFRTVDISNGEIINFKSHPEAYGTPMSTEQILKDWRSFYRCVTFHGVAYRREFYQQKAMGLSEHVFYEDNEYATFPFCLAETVTAYDLFVYEYRVGDVNQSVAVANQIKRLSHLEQVGDRMVAAYTKLPASAGKTIAGLKTQAVLSQYLDLALLAHPDRKKGRAMAADVVARYHQAAPEIDSILKNKYRVLVAMSYLHISKKTLEKVLNSRIYNRLRGNRQFD